MILIGLRRLLFTHYILLRQHQKSFRWMSLTSSCEMLLISEFCFVQRSCHVGNISSHSTSEVEQHWYQDNSLIGDCLRTPGATGTGLENGAALRQMESVNLGTNSHVSIVPESVSDRVSTRFTANISEVKNQLRSLLFAHNLIKTPTKLFCC